MRGASYGCPVDNAARCPRGCSIAHGPPYNKTAPNSVSAKLLRAQPHLKYIVGWWIRFRVLPGAPGRSEPALELHVRRRGRFIWRKRSASLLFSMSCQRAILSSVILVVAARNRP
jgi:hypothetical protein